MHNPTAHALDAVFRIPTRITIAETQRLQLRHPRELCDTPFAAHTLHGVHLLHAHPLHELLGAVLGKLGRQPIA